MQEFVQGSLRRRIDRPKRRGMDTVGVHVGLRPALGRRAGEVPVPSPS
jgi:hypothetical protein